MSRGEEAYNAYRAKMEGHTHSIRHCAFAPTSCAACRVADGETISIDLVISEMSDHSEGMCSFTHIGKPEPPIEPPVDVCKGIRDRIVGLEQERHQQQARATAAANALAAAGPDTAPETIAGYVKTMFDAMRRVQEIDTEITQLRGELLICEAGGHI